MSNDQWYIERNEDGRYGARKGGARRASAVTDTQLEAIERAQEIDSKAHINIERVRNTDRGSRDKWRSL